MTLPYRAIWERELADGKHGQDRRKPSTWRIDALYRAVLQQIKAEEAEDILALALDQGAHAESIAALVAEVRHERQRAHEIFLSQSVRDAAA